MRFESTTKSVSLAKASPLTAPRVYCVPLFVTAVSPLSRAVKFFCPITPRAAWPVIKSAPMAAAEVRTRTIKHFFMIGLRGLQASIPRNSDEAEEFEVSIVYGCGGHVTPGRVVPHIQ